MAMTPRSVQLARTFAALAAAVALASVTAIAQSASNQGGKAWKAPRAADGHADISGVWEHNAATPLQRPDELAGRAELTDQELRDLQATAAKLFDGNGDAAFGDAIYVAALKNVLEKRRGSPRATPEPATTTRSGSSDAGSRSEPR